MTDNAKQLEMEERKQIVELLANEPTLLGGRGLQEGPLHIRQADIDELVSAGTTRMKTIQYLRYLLSEEKQLASIEDLAKVSKTLANLTLSLTLSLSLS
eukprot:CAMPEP_0175135298 /NCGR_PEP_ID=MMETSP0087-20121206/8646_1 /TAXON_ID=136419 /ORGANISM="Unknown Unknown, Strain D1" /LENGTH=98 /DNA_ID=CAMNT_0016417935 /DNA_START=512 /DNA_END=804 /DNA_ORIENTATION=+